MPESRDIPLPSPMSSSKLRLYLFGWPSYLGGADTKLAHLLRLLHRDCEITVVPNDDTRLTDRHWIAQMQQLGVEAMSHAELPERTEGLALALSNDRFFTQRYAYRAKERGLKVIWSSEMMWHH